MSRIIKNNPVLNSLPSINQDRYQFAYLIPETVLQPNQKNKDPDPVFSFLYNPESINKSVQIQYQQTVIPFAGLQPVTYTAGSNMVTTFSNLYLDSRDEKKSLQPILDKLIKLREPTQQNKLVGQPTRVYFRWGANKHPLSVVTDIQIGETSWINGYPVRANINLSLLEVSASESSPQMVAKTIQEAIAANTARGNLPKQLSDKQVQDGIKRVKEWINANRTFLPKNIQLTLQDPNAEIRINKDSGSVDLYDALNNYISNLGNYNGGTFTPIKLAASTL